MRAASKCGFHPPAWRRRKPAERAPTSTAADAACPSPHVEVGASRTDTAPKGIYFFTGLNYENLVAKNRN